MQAAVLEVNLLEQTVDYSGFHLSMFCLPSKFSRLGVLRLADLRPIFPLDIDVPVFIRT
jgi:hypothetical protein